MMRDLSDRKTDRRRFLRDLATASGLVAVAGSAGAGVANAPTAPEPKAGKPAGYRVTPHVAKYYDKARI
jgi:hypothetical protein